ncbi:MAG: hypothetical protein AAGC55_15870 [Myxococcota bacterium]
MMITRPALERLARLAIAVGLAAFVGPAALAISVEHHWGAGVGHAGPPAPPPPGTTDNRALSSVLSIAVPPGWNRDPAAAQQAVSSARAAAIYAGASLVYGEAWSASEPGIVLFVTWVEVPEAAMSEGRPMRARQILDWLRAAPERAALEPLQTELLSWLATAEDGVVSGAVRWRHTINQTQVSTRTLLAAMGDGRLLALSVECIAAIAGAGSKACDAVADGLAVAVPETERAPLEMPPQARDRAGDGAARAEPVAPAPSAASTAPPPPTMGNPDQGAIVYVAPERGGAGEGEDRNQWMYVIGGLLLLLAFYLTTRNQPTAAEESGTASDAPPRTDQE